MTEERNDLRYGRKKGNWHIPGTDYENKYTGNVNTFIRFLIQYIIYNKKGVLTIKNANDLSGHDLNFLYFYNLELINVKFIDADLHGIIFENADLSDCNFKGLCKGGVCWCKDGFTGPSCETQVDLSIEAAAMGAQDERSKLIASAASLPMNIVCIIGFGAFVIGLVGAIVWRKKIEARNKDMKNSVSNSYMKVPLFQQ